MKDFCGEDFLLSTDLAKSLYREIKNEPILDYHCHLQPKMMAEKTKFENLGQAWLEGDHYKWRLMRAFGIPEKYVTGNASWWDKYQKFVEAIEMSVGNPVSQWCQLELRIYFDITLPLSTKNAKLIWDQAQVKIDQMTCRDFLEKSNVYAVCTTDDPCDDLSYHDQLKMDWKAVKVIGNFRPDKLMKVNADSFGEYIKRLSDTAKVEVKNWDSMIQALEERINFFNNHGGHGADHALDRIVYVPAAKNDLDQILQKRLNGAKLDEKEFHMFISNLMLDLGRLYKKYDWVMMWHMVCDRDSNQTIFEKLGSDVGADNAGEQIIAKDLNAMLAILEKEGNLPRTSLFSLNKMNWETIVTSAANYQSNDEGIKGRVQFGTAWWFTDTYEGNKQQIQDFAENGVLGVNIGMLTDSRSFLSFARHDYYRRLLCDIIGGWAEKGLCTNDMDVLTKLVKSIAFSNAKEFFRY